jgi:hypothetical protein
MGRFTVTSSGKGPNELRGAVAVISPSGALKRMDPEMLLPGQTNLLKGIGGLKVPVRTISALAHCTSRLLPSQLLTTDVTSHASNFPLKVSVLF